VSVNPTPTIAISADGPTTFCDGDSVRLWAPSGFVGYVWSDGSTDSEITVGRGGSYSVVVSDANGCGATATIDVVVNPTPSIAISASGPTTFCAGDSVTLSAPAGFASYRWSDGSTERAIVAKSSGSYSVAAADSNGCGGIAAIEVHVNARPVLAITPSGPTTFCDGDSVTLSGTSGYLSYRWSTGDSAASIVVRASGSYGLRVIDGNGCSADTEIVVSVNPVPSPVITGVLSFCDGGSTALDAGAGYEAYRWSNGETTRTITVTGSDTFSVAVANSFGCWSVSPTVSTRRFPAVLADITPLRPPVFCEGDSTVLAAPIGHIDYRWSTGDSSQTIVVRAAGNYSVTVIDTNGCSASASFTVGVNPKPTPRIAYTGTTTFCEGESLTLDAGDDYAAYQWSSGEITRQIVVRESGVYRVTVINANGCIGISDSLVVMVNPRPFVAINGASTVCPNTSATYSVRETPGERYAWKVTGGDGAIISGDGTSAISVRWGALGDGRVEVTATSAAGCMGSSDMGVRIGSELTPTITADRPTSLCPGDSVTLDAGAYDSYRWSTGASTRTITVRAPGSYSVTVADASGCGGTSKPMAVTLNPGPSPVIATPNGTTMCEGESIVLDAGAGYGRYLWTNGARTRQITVREPGSYAVTVTDSSGCSNISPAVAVGVTAKPTPRIIGPTLVCRGSTVGYSTSAVAGNSYQWQVSGGSIVSGAGTHQVIVHWGDGGNGSLDLIETVGGEGCAGIAGRHSVEIGSKLEPLIAAEGSTTFCKGGSVVLDAGAGFTSYRWSNGELTQRITASTPGAYSVTVTDAGGCSGVSPDIIVEEKPELVPVVLPRGDVVLCEGESTRLDAPAGYALYRWSTGETDRSITVTRSGNYSVHVVDVNGCGGTSKDIVVKVNPTPAKPAITFVNDTLVATAAVVYQWRNAGQVIPDADGRLLPAAQAGIYTVTIIDSNGCSATSDPFELLLFPHRTVRLDTVRATVGDRLRLTMRIWPPLTQDDQIGGFSVKLRVDPKALFPHTAISPDGSPAGEHTVMHRQRDGRMTIDRPQTAPALLGEELFQIELEGLASGQPEDPVMIESIDLYLTREGEAIAKSGRFIVDDNVTIGGHGLVLLDGCVITHGFAYGKGAQIGSIRPNPIARAATVSYTAAPGTSPRMVLVNMAGIDVATFELPEGTGGAQETPIDIGSAPSGAYMLELRDGIGRSMIPVVITK